MSFIPRQEPDRLPGRWLAVIAAGAVIFSIILIGAALLLERQRPDPAPELRPAPMRVGAMETELFREEATRVQIDPSPKAHRSGGPLVGDLWPRQRARLESYGWVDRRAEVIHIPLDRAMNLWLESGAGQEGRR
jgi:hypothetical protein